MHRAPCDATHRILTGIETTNFFKLQALAYVAFFPLCKRMAIISQNDGQLEYGNPSWIEKAAVILSMLLHMRA
jgi:hypothetical protein